MVSDPMIFSQLLYCEMQMSSPRMHDEGGKFNEWKTLECFSAFPRFYNTKTTISRQAGNNMLNFKLSKQIFDES